MKRDYSRNIRLRCIVCGSDDCFECNENKTYIKCTKCNKEYHGGYDELVELNTAFIDMEISQMKDEIGKDLHDDILKTLKSATRGTKFIKIK